MAPPPTSSQQGPKVRQVFRVPLGLLDDRLVPPSLAQRDHSYECPSCRSKLVLRSGARVRSHFAHKPSSSCTGETVLHQTAKLLIAEAAAGAISGDRNVSIKSACGECRRMFERALPPSRATDVKVESRLPSGLVIDVLLLAVGVPRLAIEVLVTHRVDEHKAQVFGTLPWIEVRATDIIENPFQWVVTNGQLKKDICPLCRIVIRLQEEQAARCRSRWHVSVAEPYSYEVARCWKCSEVLLYFDWPGKEAWTSEPPPEPRPRTLQLRYSQTTRSKYWASTCPKCRALQGDFDRSSSTSDFHYELEKKAKEILDRKPSTQATG